MRESVDLKMRIGTVEGQTVSRAGFFDSEEHIRT